jgi:hypothetical protein
MAFNRLYKESLIMAKPEKRWQLLLVADDGRIIPFKRIKGMVMTLTVLLVLLVLICAGLAWQLTAEKVRHRRTADQLADATRQMGTLQEPTRIDRR